MTQEKDSDPGFSRKEIQELWRTGTPETWRALLEDLNPDGRWTIKGSSIRGLCPYHTEGTPSFNVNLAQGFAHCFGCGKHQGSPLYLVKELLKGTLAEAATKLKDHLGATFTPKVLNHLARFDLLQQTKRLILGLANETLLEAYNNQTKEEYAYAQPAVAFLLKRGIPFEAWHELPIGTLPTAQHMYSRLKEESPDVRKGVQNYLEYAHNSNMFGWIMFVNTRGPTDIARIRLRRPDLGTPEKTMIVLEDPYENTVGLFGLNLYSSLFMIEAGKTASVVEGEMDQLAIAANQIQTGNFDRIVVATGGKADRDLSDLLHVGVERVDIIGDLDENLAGQQWALNLAKDAPEGISCRIFNWPSHYVAPMDPDKAIATQDFKRFYEELLDPDNYVYPRQVLTQKAAQLLQRIDPGDLRRRQELIGSLASEYLPNEVERNAFFSGAAEQFGIDPNLLERESVAALDTPQGFSERLVKKLAEYYAVIGHHYDSTASSGTVLILWNRAKGDFRRLPLSKIPDCVAILAIDLGMFSAWCIQHIGIPRAMTHKYIKNQGWTPLPLEQQERNLRASLGLALQGLVGTAPDLRDITELRQGIHVLPPDAEGILETVIVNGKRAFLLRYEPEQLVVRKLETPLYRKFLFMPDPSDEWEPALKTTDDLERLITGVDLGEVYGKVFKAIKAGWDFVNGDIHVQYMTLLAMFLPCYRAFPGTIMTFITGEFSSGKSKLMRFLKRSALDDDKSRFDGLVAPAIVSHNYTEAAVRQLMSCVSKTLILDEFENKEDKSRQSSLVSEIQRSLRSMINEPVRSFRGTVTGKAIFYDLKFPFIMAAINPPPDPTDRSRVTLIHMKKDDVKDSPDKVIAKLYSPEELYALRLNVSFGLLPYIPHLRVMYHKVLNEKGAIPPWTESRFRDMIVPLVALCKFLDLDYKAFAFNLVQANGSDERRLEAPRTETNEIYSAVYDTAITVELGSFRGQTTVRQMLCSKDFGRDKINSCSLGIYFLPVKTWLVIHWPHAYSSILSKSNSLLREKRNPQVLKILADRNPNVVPITRDVWRTISYLLPGNTVTKSEVTVLDLEKEFPGFSTEVPPNVTELDSRRRTETAELPAQGPASDEAE